MSQRVDEGSSLDRRTLEAIQSGTLRYSYRDIPLLKDPFDLAIYQWMLWRVRPRTLVEIGSKHGGSALWFSETLRTFGVECAIHSIDLNPPDLVAPGVTFYKGDGRRLGETLSDSAMAGAQRPLMVVEDADHRPATTLAVLRFFDVWLQPGEYMVVEDGIIDDLYGDAGAEAYGGGPRLAIGQFLEERGTDYEIDTELCDFFGKNVTWNVNGYLRRR
jgi:cephalosporin hydroxylase